MLLSLAPHCKCQSSKSNGYLILSGFCFGNLEERSQEMTKRVLPRKRKFSCCCSWRLPWSANIPCLCGSHGYKHPQKREGKEPGVKCTYFSYWFPHNLCMRKALCPYADGQNQDVTTSRFGVVVVRSPPPPELPVLQTTHCHRYWLPQAG